MLEIERQAFKHWADLEKRHELLHRLGHIENAVSKIPVPAKFGSLFYGLREHIGFVRSILLSQSSDIPLEPELAADEHGKNGMA